MIIYNLNVFGIAINKPEHQSPRPVDRHRPLALPVSNQSMKPDRFERRDVIKRLRGPQNLQSRHRFCDVHSAELALAIYGKAFRRAIGEAPYHMGGVA